jgi:hypothetical protein
MKLIVEDSEKNDILSKYSENTSNELLTYLRRNFPVTAYPLPKYHPETDSYRDIMIPFIVVDEKSYYVDSNKKNLVNKIFYTIEDQFTDLNTDIKRRTIKKYLDMIGLTNFENERNTKD